MNGQVAIVGMAGRFPGAADVREFWRNLVDGRECLGATKRCSNGDAEAAHWVKADITLPNVDKFDAEFFGLNPRESEMTDPQHRILLELAWEAIEDAGYRLETHGSSVGVFAGANFTSYFTLPEEPDLLASLPQMIGADKDYLSTRIAYRLNLVGPAFTVQSACSTSLVAIHLACQSLLNEECEAALAGGVSITVPRMDKHFYMPGGLLSPDGFCRAFDADAKGTIFTEGGGMVMLMRLEEALERRKHIYAVIRGSAMNNNGGVKAGFTAPSIDGQVRVLRQAHAAAGVSAKDFGFVEAHGTGTVLGDAIEVAALTRAFRESTSDVGYCRLGSVKTNVGHMASAAGVTGLIKTALTLEHGLIPPTVNLRTLNPELDLERSPFLVNTEAVAWPAKGQPRIAGVSSFGVGGTNVHVVLQEPPPARTENTYRAWHALPVSAKTEDALQFGVANLSMALHGADETALADAAYTQATGREAFDHRAVLVARTQNGLPTWSTLSPAGHLPRIARPRIAFLFPGQGSQYVGMATRLYETEPVFRDHLDECLEILGDYTQIDLRSLLLGQPNDAAGEALRQTGAAQPALFATCYAQAKLLESFGIVPELMLGHSIGEYVAAHLAGVFSLHDALELVVKRGALMEQVMPGAMLSVLAPEDEITWRLPPDLDLAAVNGARHTVVAGPAEEIAAFAGELKADGVTCRTLQTSHAFHSRMMAPILEAFTQTVSSVDRNPPGIPYMSNVTGSRVTMNELARPEYWASQIRLPVQFGKAVSELIESGANIFVEVGPGRQLCGLAQSATAGRMAFVQTMPAIFTGKAADVQFSEALAELWTLGAGVNWSAAYAEEERRVASLPTYPFQRTSFWLEPRAPAPVAKGLQRNDIDDWMSTPVWSRRPITETQTSWAGDEHILLVSADASLGVRLAACLRSQGVATTLVQHSRGARANCGELTCDLTDPAWAQHLKETLAEGARCGRVVFVCAPEHAGSYLDSGRFLAAQQIGLYALLRLLSCLRDSPPLQLDIVGGSFFEVVGKERVQPELAPILAFATVTPQEHEKVRCRVIDIESENRLEEAALRKLVQILASPLDEPILALRGNHKWVRTFHALSSDARSDQRKVKQGGAYLITGGFGDIGITVAELLAAEANAKLVLVGRRHVPDREHWPALLLDGTSDPDTTDVVRSIMHIEALGGRVWTFQADVSSLEDVRRLKTFITAEFGALSGAVLAAGKLGLNNTQFTETDVEIYAEHFQAKTLGLMNFISEFDDQDLDFCVVVSSLSSILGGLGHCAYSAANQAADALIWRRNSEHERPWLSSNWDLWKPRKAVVEVSRTMARAYETAIDLDEGKAVFRRLLNWTEQTQVIISTRDLQFQYNHWVKKVNGAQEQPMGEPATLHARPTGLGVFTPPRGEIEVEVAALWCGALGLEQVGRNDDFFALGGHSLLTVQILERTAEIFGIEVPIEEAFAASTVGEFAGLVETIITKAMAEIGTQ